MLVYRNHKLAVVDAKKRDLPVSEGVGQAKTYAHKLAVRSRTRPALRRKNFSSYGKRKTGDGVAWQFKAGGPTDFNIHYHPGKEVTYPESRRHIASADATLCPPLDQHYRWKWSNASVHGVDIEVPLEQVGEANRIHFRPGAGPRSGVRQFRIRWLSVVEEAGKGRVQTQYCSLCQICTVRPEVSKGLGA